MKKLQKVFALVLISVMALGAFGCGAKQDEENTPENPSAD